MVVVFGSVNLDLTATVPRIPRAGETLAGSHFAMAPGGKGANQALSARRAGARVAMVGAVGRDAFAAAALANLKAAGVDLDRMANVAAPTGVALINVAADGANAITVVAGANAHAKALQVPDEWLGPDSVVLMQLEVPMREVESLALHARERGARVLLNAAPAGALAEPLWRTLDVLLVNEGEAAVVGAACGLPVPAREFAQAARARYGCTVVVTLGSAGAVAVNAHGSLELPAPPVDVVDTTGAGDAFCGAFACAWQRGASLPEAIAQALVAGARACTEHGAQGAAAPFSRRDGAAIVESPSSSIAKG
jgi:ribokinase